MRLRGHGWIVPVVVGVVSAIAAGLAVWGWQPGPPPPLEKGTLIILSGADESVDKWRHALVDMWNVDHPDSRAEIRELPQAADGQRAEMIAQAESDTEVDIYNLDVTMLAEFAAPPGKESYLRPMDESQFPPGFTDGFLDKPLESCSYDGTLWALPLNTDAGLLFYRNDLVPRAPTSWDEVVSMTRQARAPDSTAGWVGQLDPNYEGLTVNALEAIWGAGGTVLDGGKVVEDPEKLSEGLRRLLATPAGRPVIHPGVGGFDETASREAFAAGEALFMRNWPVHYSKLLNPDADVARPKQVSFDIAPLPGPSVLGGQNLAVSAKSRQPRAAQALVQFMTSESSQLLLARYGGFAPTRRAAYDDKAARTTFPYLADLRSAVDDARLRPATPHYPVFSEVFREIVQYAMANGGALPRDYADRLTKALQGRR